MKKFSEWAKLNEVNIEEPKWNGLMPKELFDWLSKRPPKSKDRIWEWADNYPDIAKQIVEVVSTKDGSSNEELAIANQQSPKQPFAFQIKRK